ncbi:hypothetical protein [Kribbella shirazensis]|uniref:Uncharacterized protein n=1 Tax=Kribbella shirazensis TaxID=1105143 RepID=A0A7X5VHM8_9ACTN|nr:hypothetical protein [Kribbella shirazensis]NIK61451.1 hypothetical protein [Kribbella shirazensis]
MAGLSEEIRVTTEENELSLEEMSAALPDTPAIMEKVGHCWWHLIYAARGGNWGLAGYYLRRVAKLENALKTLRPKHRERLERFQAEALPPVVDAIEAKDLEQLERAFAAATDMANVMHGNSGYPYIKWVLPSEPPAGLQLAPVEPAEPADVSVGNGQVTQG